MIRGKTRLSGKNLLFAELIIVILFFSVASAGCVLLFAEAYSDGKQSRDLTEAVIIAQNFAECFKATDGDFTETLKILNEQFYFDENPNKEYFESKEQNLISFFEIEETDSLIIGIISIHTNFPNEHHSIVYVPTPLVRLSVVVLKEVGE
jgi:hypothetical protein